MNIDWSGGIGLCHDVCIQHVASVHNRWQRAPVSLSRNELSRIQSAAIFEIVKRAVLSQGELRNAAVHFDTEAY